MTCEQLIPVGRAAIAKWMQTSLDHWPSDYVDRESGCRVTFSKGPSGGAYGLPPFEQVYKYSVVCGGRGEPSHYDVVRRALVKDCEGRTIVPPPHIIPPPVTTTPTKPAPAPPATITNLPAPTTAPVSTPTQTITPTPQLIGGPSMTSIQFGGIQPTSPGIPGGFPQIDPTATSGFWDWFTGVTQPITGAIIDWATGQITGGETPTSPGTQPTGFAPGCPQGYKWDGTQCVKEGVVGWFQQHIPGGATGTMTDVYGQAVMGAFNMPALVPAQVGTITDKYGATRPILRCPRGAVLGRDDLCYQKGSISRKQRKWPPATRPLLTGGEMKALRKAKSLEGRVKRAWMAAGKPGQRRLAPPKRKR